MCLRHPEYPPDTVWEWCPLRCLTPDTEPFIPGVIIYTCSAMIYDRPYDTNKHLNIHAKISANILWLGYYAYFHHPIDWDLTSSLLRRFSITLTLTRSSSGYFQKDTRLLLSTHHLRCQAPNPPTSSNMFWKRLKIVISLAWLGEEQCHVIKKCWHLFHDNQILPSTNTFYYILYTTTTQRTQPYYFNSMTEFSRHAYNKSLEDDVSLHSTP